MGKFAPVFLAYILNCFDVHIFRVHTPGCEPLVSYVIFLTGVFFLLWDIRLYPTSLRKLSKLNGCIIEFLIAAFFTEHIMMDFWQPLETSLMTALPEIAKHEKQLLARGGWKSGGIFSIFNIDGVLIASSYLLSMFFLIAVLHATRIIDLRLLSCGIGIFAKDVFQRLRKFRKKISKYICPRRQSKFKVKCNTSSSKSLASSCGSSEFETFEPYGDTEEDNQYENYNDRSNRLRRENCDFMDDYEY